jgi:hypothetical protein
MPRTWNLRSLILSKFCPSIFRTQIVGSSATLPLTQQSFEYGRVTVSAYLNEKFLSYHYVQRDMCLPIRFMEQSAFLLDQWCDEDVESHHHMKDFVITTLELSGPFSLLLIYLAITFFK